METRRLTIPAAEEILNLYFPVLDYGFVSLVDYMGGDESVERAARGSYTVGEEKRTEKQRRNLIRYMFSHAHSTPFESVELVFHIGLPIVVMRQLIRHRTASVSEFSGRYSPMPLLFYKPDRDRVGLQSAQNKQGTAGIVDDQEYGKFMANMRQTRTAAQKQYCDALHDGISKEISRIDLPLSMYTYAYWKMDLRNLLHLIGLRSDSHAQWEIQQYSNVFAGMVSRVAPLSFEAFQDYQQTAVKFTQIELKFLPKFYSAINMQTIFEEMAAVGMTKREIGEFQQKMLGQGVPSYNLDLSRARPAQYYSDLVDRFKVEVPSE